MSQQAAANEEVKRELNDRVRRKELDGYVVIPPDVLTGKKAEYYGSNVGDFINSMRIEEGLSRAVNEQRLADTGVDQKLLREISKRVTVNTFKVSEKTEEQDSGEAFFLVLGVGLLILIMILIYGGTVLSAVMEEKETRIAEVLFSSVRAFPLMLGKLVGVSLVALTQFAIWGILIGGFSVYGVATLKRQGLDLQLPPVSAANVVYSVLFFLLGFFIYASVYAVIGSIVRTYDESQGFLMVAIVPLILSFYLVFPIMRSPESTLALLDLNRPSFFSCDNAGAHRVSTCSFLADRAVTFNWLRHGDPAHLAGRPYLSNWDVNVWQARHNSGSLALGATSVRHFQLPIADCQFAIG